MSHFWGGSLGFGGVFLCCSKKDCWFQQSITVQERYMFTLVKSLYRGPNFKSIIPPCSRLKSYLYAIELTWFLNQCDSSANTIIETFFFNLTQNRVLSPIFLYSWNRQGNFLLVFVFWVFFFLEALQFRKSIPKQSG